MKMKSSICSLMMLLALLVGFQTPMLAGKKGCKSSSSSHHSKFHCCDEVLDRLEQIQLITAQDLVVDQTTLNVVNEINTTTQDDLAIDQETLEIVSHIEDCACHCEIILPEAFMDGNGVLSQTVVLNAPGQYCLAEDIDFEPLVAGTQAIQIVADNVTLDLQGHALRQINSTADVVGVRLGNSAGTVVFKNITVKNGDILTFTGQGIGANNTIVATPAAFQFLTFTDLDILECGTDANAQNGSGLNLSSNGDQNLFTNPPVAYRNVVIENCNANRCLGRGSIRVVTGDNVVLRNCQANDLSSTANVSTFAYRLTVKDLQMFDCQGNGTRSTSATNVGSQLGGMLGSNSIEVFVQNCQFNETFGEASVFVLGANISNQQNAVYENCQFNNSRGGPSTTLAGGIHMSDSAFQQTQGNGLKFINCQFNGAFRSSTGTGLIPELSQVNAASILTTRNIEFIGCQACNITTDNPNFNTYGLCFIAYPEDPIPYYANAQNVSITECLVSDISGPNEIYGLCFQPADINRIGQQGALINVVVKDCVVERIKSSTTTRAVTGIGEGLFQAPGTSVFPSPYNLYVQGCRVSDVTSNFASPSPLSAGIFVQATNRPVIANNSVSSCDRGILLTGTNDIYPTDLFQLASSPANSLAEPPIAIDLIGILTDSTGTATQTGTTVQGIGTAFTAAMNGGTTSFGSVAGTGSQTGDIVTAAAAVFTSNMVGSTISFPAGYTTYIIDFISPTSVQVSTTLPAPLPPAQAFTINVNIAPITAVNVGLQQLTVSKTQTITPASTFTITYGLPAAAPTHTFTNTVGGRGGPVVIAPSSSTVDLNRDFLRSTPTNLNFGGGVQQWQPGDTITYSNGGGTSIGNLVNGATYYLIVYIPGFSENGVIQNNEVDNCRVSGYEDDRPITTASAWINNVAVLNGPTPATTNYLILWSPGPDPVDHGFVPGPYPANPNKYFNLSLEP